MIGQLIVNSLALGSIYALTALGFSVIYKASGVVNFAQGEMMMLGAIIALVLFRDMHLGYSLSFVISIAACMSIGMLVERIAFRPLLNAPHFTVLLATVAIAQIVRSGVRVFYGQEMSSFPAAWSTAPIDIWGIRFTQLSLGIVLTTAGVLLLALLLFSKTRMGWRCAPLRRICAARPSSASVSHASMRKPGQSQAVLPQSAASFWLP